MDEPAMLTTTQCKAAGDGFAEQSLEQQLTTVPNPATHFFTLRVVRSRPTATQVRLVDAMGLVMEVRRGLSANSTLTVGEHYRPGNYYAEALQSGRKAILKLVKSSH